MEKHSNPRKPAPAIRGHRVQPSPGLCGQHPAQHPPGRTQGVFPDYPRFVETAVG